MHTPSRLRVSLAEPPGVRWAALRPYTRTMRRLINMYGTDLGGTSRFHDLVKDFYESFLPPDHWQECRALASMIDVAAEDVAVVNVYYDLVKLLIGCTAFAVDTDVGPLHARNLDWWTEHALLSTSTLIVEMVDAPAGQFQLMSQPLQATSCRRLDRAVALLAERRPRTAADCFAMLTDPDIQMNITVQQIVMSAATGLIDVRLPGDATPL